ncbi:MAG TPA: sigma-70 family RNA polymerase sigma factor [Bryobacteraceae bacterium]|nr:sigma-70 family RNA polymerase sigma factor [Bryobacteraceae bacterium]
MLSLPVQKSPREANARLATRIANQEPDAIEEFYAQLKLSLRDVLWRRLPEHDPDDILHDTLAISLKAIQNGELRNPGAIRSYAEVILNRIICARIGQVMRARTRSVNADRLQFAVSPGMDAEASMLLQERIGLMKVGMTRLRQRDIELLTRFYLNNQPYRDICREMKLTEPQFHRFKHRAKAQLKAILCSRE